MNIPLRASHNIKVLNPHDFHLPPRDLNSHKGDFGKILVIGGSDNMNGAPILSSLAALRCGAGYVYLAYGDFTPRRDLPYEIMTKVLPVKDGAFISPGSEGIEKLIHAISAIVLGPGLSTNDQTAKLVQDVLLESKKAKIPVVLDADGLRCLKIIKNFTADLTSHCIMTPHPGEAAELLSTTPAKIQNERYTAAKSLYQKYAGTIVLKGAGTIVLEAENEVLNTIGNPMLATAGSGDVLCGIIAALLAQGLTNFNAAALGVYLHAKSADILFEETGGPLIASDLALALPECIGELWSQQVVNEPENK